ncbi:Type II secretion system protein D precursor [Aeoliella mucimassa]|uniref:Type II secretion system protein D n=2 Tax=Aeoliella mucimassa TaxID=2527972 RepID=A0A518AJK1_9BACT|nr:Type II secretion system protein D precursor [Aeoliella mucimassa]
MYDQNQPVIGRSTRTWFGAALAVALMAWATHPAMAQTGASTAAEFSTPNIIRHISRESERLEMTTNSSRILTLDLNIPKAQVNNPELVAVTPLSAKQLSISAKKPGVTQINLWDENDKVHTIDVVIYGDVRELEHALKVTFPNSSVSVRKYSQSLMLTGFVDSPDHVGPMMRLAEDYAPKVINSLEVGGVQQVVLKVKMYEISRTKLRQLGVDWALTTEGGGFVGSRPNGLLSATGIRAGTTGGGSTVEFGIVSGSTSFFGFLDALQQHNVAKILAEPNLVSVSGRPAQFLEGGEVPILVPQSLGTSSIEYKPFGTQVDFLPIVLGNGNIRLEVRPRVSSPDSSISVTLNDNQIPGFRVRQADTAVEMRAGQTFALAGLIQRQTESIKTGIPILADIPGIGVPFRGTKDEVNEIELLILVTPEFVDAMDPHEVPPCGPGEVTMSPSNHQLYCEGQIEVPNAYGPCGLDCGGCGQEGCQGGYPSQGSYPMMGPGEQMVPLQQGMPYEQPVPTPAGSPAIQYDNAPTSAPVHGELHMPDLGAANQSASRSSQAVASGAYANPRTANFRRVPTQSAPPSVPSPSRSDYSIEGGLIGPVGYDTE